MEFMYAPVLEMMLWPKTPTPQITDNLIIPPPHGLTIMTLVPPPLFQVMYRERAAGMYDELPFAVAQCLVEVPYNLIQAILFSLVSYFCMGFEINAGATSHNAPYVPHT